MSELCLSGTLKKSKLLCTLLSYFLLFFSFLRSHPLYLSYVIFFSPYLLKLLSFLSPLFITTSLLLLGFLTLAHEKSPLESPESKLGFLISTCRAVLQRLGSSENTDNAEEEDFRQFEELEAYKIVFDTSSLNAGDGVGEISEPKSEENGSKSLDGDSILSSLNSAIENLEEKTVEIAWEETSKKKPAKEAEKLEGFLKELNEFENVIYSVDEKKKVEVELPSFKIDKAEKPNKEVPIPDHERDYSPKASLKSKSFLTSAYTTDNGLWETPSSRSVDENSCLGSYGSMRKEKEWRRTLACKLYEERHNVVDGGEGMDLLWETYEVDSSEKPKHKNSIKSKSKKKDEFEYFDEEEEEEEEDIDGRLCCLQALKFSTGKMNLGMKRPNLVKISKVFKGIGWLHNVSKLGKKKG